MSTFPFQPSLRGLQRQVTPTRWSLVRRVQTPGLNDTTRASDEFCRCYWYPLYSFLRHCGYPHADSQDHVQTFLIRLLREDLLAIADVRRGRLWNLLITLLRRHVSARTARDRAQKRGGKVTHLPLDWAAAQVAYSEDHSRASSPEDAFRRALAEQLVAMALSKLRDIYKESGRLHVFEALLPALEGPLPDQTFDEIAGILDMRPGTVRVSAARLRERFRRCVIDCAPAALGMPNGARLEQELAALFCDPILPSSV